MTCDDVFEALTRGPFPAGRWDDEPVEEHLAHCGECRRLAAALQPAVELFREAIAPDESHGLPGYRGRAVAPAHFEQELYGTPASDEASRRADFAGGLHPTWPRVRGIIDECHAQGALAGRASASSRRELAAVAAIRAARSRTNLLRFAAAALLGVAVAAAGRGVNQWNAGDRHDGPALPALLVGAARSDAESSLAHRHGAWLAALALPDDCTPRWRRDADQEAPTGRRLANVQLASVDAASQFDCCTDCHSAGRSGLLPAEKRSVVVRACSACH